MTLKNIPNPYFNSGLHLSEVVPLDTKIDALRQLYSLCPHADQTPLHVLDTQEAQLACDAIYVKDERSRMGLGSFKALGAASVIASIAANRADGNDTKKVLSGMTFVTASAGNHGLSVVAGANAFGANAVIYLAETVPVSFQEKLRAIGAEVVVEGHDYEASMTAAEQAATDNNWFLLSDSTWPGYSVGVDVMKGYMLSALEIVAQCPHTPTHLFLQAGVGGLAAAIALYLREAYGHELRIIVVEPDRAPALQLAIQKGALCDAGEGVSIMGRLDCKRASLSALDTLARHANDFVTLTDEDVEHRLPKMATLGLETSPSGGAGLAAALMSLDEGAFGIKSTSRILCVVSEGIIDD